MNELIDNYAKKYRDDHVSELDMLTKCYSEPHRHYHTLEHISYMFKKARQHNIILTRAQTHAIWWHDVVYVPGSDMNEEKSVRLAHDYHNHLQDPDWISIVGMIMDTKTHEPRTEESAIVCDLDMLILADEAIKYRRYAKQVRKEFSMFSDEEYREGRIKFLEKTHFVNIFHSPVFEKYKAVAHFNIRNEILDLKSCS